jgi:uncharacterized membrane protein
MATLPGSYWRNLPAAVFWTITCGAAVLFAYDAIVEIAGREPGDVPGWRAALLALHASVALPLLAIAPFQFSGRLRSRYSRVHRWLGRLFLGGAIVAAVSAIALAPTFALAGARISLTLLGAVLLFCAVAAWLCARAGDFAAHRKFAIRTFAFAFAFVWVRLIGSTDEAYLSFIEDPDHQDINREWLSLVLPLLITEAWLTWIPALRGALRRSRNARQGNA